MGDGVLEAYHVPPIAPYLRGVLREATMSNYDDALRAYQHTDALMPGAPFVLADIERVTHGVHSAPKHGVVYIVSMIGRGPYKTEGQHKPPADRVAHRRSHRFRSWAVQCSANSRAHQSA